MFTTTVQNQPDLEVCAAVTSGSRHPLGDLVYLPLSVSENLWRRVTSQGRQRCPGCGAVVADQRAERHIKIGAKVVSHGRYVTFQMA
jgi:hypothetical protein